MADVGVILEAPGGYHAEINIDDVGYSPDILDDATNRAVAALKAAIEAGPPVFTFEDDEDEEDA